MTSYAALAAMTIGLLACNGDRKETPGGTAAAGAATAHDAGSEVSGGIRPPPAGSPPQQAIDPDTFDRPSETGQDGVIHAGMRFTDKNGSNVVLLVHQVEGGGDMNNRRLWIYHYVEASGKRRVLRTVRDQEENCELDNVAGFVEGSLAVTDLDGDGLGEIAFAYDLGCMSDVSPKGRKVVVLENGEKWILRGQSRVDPGGGPRLGGSFTPDPPHNRWPRTLHDHAVEVWQRFIDR